MLLWLNVCDKEHLALRNNFRVTKKFLITKFDCTFCWNKLLGAFQFDIDHENSTLLMSRHPWIVWVDRLLSAKTNDLLLFNLMLIIFCEGIFCLILKGHYPPMTKGVKEIKTIVHLTYLISFWVLIILCVGVFCLILNGYILQWQKVWKRSKQWFIWHTWSAFETNIMSEL